MDGSTAPGAVVCIMGKQSVRIENQDYLLTPSQSRYDRRTVRRRRFSGTPAKGATLTVISDQRMSLAARRDHDEFAQHEWRAGHPEGPVAASGVLQNVSRPERPACSSVETVQRAGRAQCIDPSSVD